MNITFKKAAFVILAVFMVFAICACSSKKDEDITDDSETAGLISDFYKLSDESRLLSIDLEVDPSSGLFWTYEITDENILNLSSFSINPGDENGEGAMWSTTYAAPSDKGGSVKLSLYLIKTLEDVETTNPSYVMDIDVTVDGKISVKSITQ